VKVVPDSNHPESKWTTDSTQFRHSKIHIEFLDNIKSMGRDPDTLQAAKKPISLASNITLQPPLSRLGKGPGLLIIVPGEYEASKTTSKHTLDREPLQKWAEEGFAVAEIKVDGTTSRSPDQEHQDTSITIKALSTLQECTSQLIGVIGKVQVSLPSYWSMLF
jgi:hypothetical protein